MDNQLGMATYAPPNLLGTAFVAPTAGGIIVSTVSTLYTLNQVGDVINLNPSSGSADISTMPTIIGIETNLSNALSNITGITYTPQAGPQDNTTTINNDLVIPQGNDFSHNPSNDSNFPTHTINANLNVGQATIIPGGSPDVQFYPNNFTVGSPVYVARSVNLHSGALGTTITSVQGVSIDATVDVNLNAGGVVAIDSVGATTLNSGAGITVEAVGAVNLTAGGTITINGVGLTEIGGTDVTINSVNKQETTTGDTNITCSAFTAQMGAVDIVSGLMGIQAGAYDLVSLAGFGFQGVGPVSFLTSGPYSFQGADATFNTPSFTTSNLLISSINGYQYVPSGPASNWSAFPATSMVNLANNNISNVGNIYGSNSQFLTNSVGLIYATQIFCYTNLNVGSNAYISSLTVYNDATTDSLTSRIASVSSATISSINGFSASQFDNSNWSIFPATTTINANNNRLSNVTTANILDLQISSINGANYITGELTGITAGTGIAVTGSAPSPTVSNTGVLSVVSGTGITSSGGQNPTVSNTGVLSVVSGNGITSTGGQNPQINLNFYNGQNTGILLTTLGGTQPLTATLSPLLQNGTKTAPNEGGPAPTTTTLGGLAFYTNGYGLTTFKATPETGGNDLQTCIVYSDNPSSTPFRPIIGSVMTVFNNNNSGNDNMAFRIFYEDALGNFYQFGSIQVSPQNMAYITLGQHNPDDGANPLNCPYAWFFSRQFVAGRYG